MQKNNIIQTKSFAFALNIIQLYKYLVNEKSEYILSKQLLRSATSIGANIEEAIASITSKEFIYKISISYKEARETNYWLKLIIASEYLNSEQKKIYSNDIEELYKILSKILITSKKNNLKSN